MSYSVALFNDKNVAEVTNHQEGGIIVMGGSIGAGMSITYNYNKRYSQTPLKSIRWLEGRKAKNTIERLTKSIELLGNIRTDDYWEATPGNAGYALYILRQWAMQHPEAEWSVSF